jgi:DNA-binding SARP family transcriptional activator
MNNSVAVLDAQPRSGHVRPQAEQILQQRAVWPNAPSGCTIQMQLLGRFALVVRGRRESIGVGCRRLLAALALRDGHAGRRELAELLWPDVTTARAAANLRSVLWRLQKCCLGVVDSDANDLRLSAGIWVDWHAVVAMARRLINQSIQMDTNELGEALACNLHDDLLPELSDEEWLTAEAEGFRQLRLHALESLSQRLTRAEWFGGAIDVALRAVRADPFRESAHQTLIQAYLAEGNKHAVRQQYQTYRQLLSEEMGLEPSDRLTALLHAAFGPQRCR